MFGCRTRREFLTQAGAVALGAGLPVRKALAALGEERPQPKVVIARDQALTRGKPDEHRELLRKLLDAALQRITGAADAPSAWRKLFQPTERIGLKVNTLGYTTPPIVADAIVAGLRNAGVPAENIIIWDRTDGELTRAGFKLNKSGSGVRCCGTDSLSDGGYEEKSERSGKVKTRFSRILTEQLDAVISVPVLKDHSIAGVTLGMKNFYGAIDSPDKLHGSHCDPYIVDLVAHPAIAKRWRLTVCNGITARYNGGPGNNPAFGWPFGGLLVGTDFVAVDAVGADIIQAQREAKGMKSLTEEGRAPRYIGTAAARGLGEADLAKIERIEL